MSDGTSLFRNILLLQGPVGPFFKNLADYIQGAGVNVHKINFNAGDWLFFHGRNSLSYRGTFENWPEYLRRFLHAQKIDAIVMFGDTRAYHRAAISIAKEEKLLPIIFEEGYVRPNFITMEPYGVNGYSIAFRRYSKHFFQNTSLHSKEQFFKNAYRELSIYSTLYYIAKSVGLIVFPYYKHHKKRSTLSEAFHWIVAGVRKILSHNRDIRIAENLVRSYPRRYFFVPLQVHNDSQICYHSRYVDVEEFVEQVVESFGRHAASDTRLVLKHHPLDRGYRNYEALIRRVAARHGATDRVFYICDAHLPALLRNAAGTVTINSTMGISSLYHGTPVKALGEAVYTGFQGLVASCSLEEFWRIREPVNQDLFGNFRKYLMMTSQINGSFYARTLDGGFYERILGRMAELYENVGVRHDC
ncbi:MAG: capsular biosynthesis protein [Phycisphaerae bacterium]|nr:capsular biosynthesis protein [Phycisphaerae bacterium]